MTAQLPVPTGSPPSAIKGELVEATLKGLRLGGAFFCVPDDPKACASTTTPGNPRLWQSQSATMGNPGLTNSRPERLTAWV